MFTNEQELILLGLLRENPRHGYEIKRRIEEILSLFAGIDLRSIYYPLVLLEKKGLVTKHKAREGKRPQRFVYELTARGGERFNELLNKSLLNFKRPQFTLDLSLYFLSYLESGVAKRRLRGRIFILNKIAKGLKQLIASRSKKQASSLSRIAEHNLRLVEAESKFLSGLVQSL